MTARRAEIESLLRARKLDVTLTTTGWAPASRADDLASTGVPAIDAALGGGLRRGHLSEIAGRRSAGSTTVLARIFAAATRRGELVALIDTCDRFDPASAAAAGVELSALLWIRGETADAARALKAMNLVLQAGGFGVVALDLADVSMPALRQVPSTTWIRLARVIEGSQTVALLVGRERLARSPGGVTIALDRPEQSRGAPSKVEGPRARSRGDRLRAGPSDAPAGRWSGAGDRARRLEGVALYPRVIRAR
jgi:hypothetical protein